MIDIEIIKPSDNEYLDFLCIDDLEYPFKIVKRVIRLKRSSLVLQTKLYIYYDSSIYRLIAYEGNLDRPRD